MINYNVEELPSAEKAQISNEEIEQHVFASSLRSMLQRVKNEPKLKMIYSGIKDKSVGVIFGPSKSGKTMYCENLAMSIAAGVDNYLGLPICIENRKVVFVSFEEHYINRTERNEKQIARLVAQYGDDWLDNYNVGNEHIPRYITSKDQWAELADYINAVQPGIVFLDSLTHMYQGAIEDSKVAVELMRNLRGLAETTDTTIAAIHHTHKMYGQRLTVDTIAGSRVLAQETDFMIGLSRTPDGQKYIKDVAFRYAPSIDDSVRTYNIGADCWLNITGQSDEGKLLSTQDGRKDDGNRNLILDFLTQEKEAGVAYVQTNTIIDKFVANDTMTRTTVFNNINRLLDENVIVRFGKGAYSLAA